MEQEKRKSIRVSTEVYQKLRKYKGSWESMSDVIDRLIAVYGDIDAIKERIEKERQDAKANR